MSEGSTRYRTVQAARATHPRQIELTVSHNGQVRQVSAWTHWRAGVLMRIVKDMFRVRLEPGQHLALRRIYRDGARMRAQTYQDYEAMTTQPGDRIELVLYWGELDDIEYEPVDGEE